MGMGMDLLRSFGVGGFADQSQNAVRDNVKTYGPTGQHKIELAGGGEAVDRFRKTTENTIPSQYHNYFQNDGYQPSEQNAQTDTEQALRQLRFGR